MNRSQNQNELRTARNNLVKELKQKGNPSQSDLLDMVREEAVAVKDEIDEIEEENENEESLQKKVKEMNLESLIHS